MTNPTKNLSANKNKLWGGRFEETTDAFVADFTASINFDQRLAYYDILGSIAHAIMLAKVDIITTEESEILITGLVDILKDIFDENMNWSIELEDVHMNIEAELTRRVGSVGKKLHTARSRNDQVATDLRLFLRTEGTAIIEKLLQLQLVLIDLAEQHAATVMPGFTHLQPAQPIALGHHWLAWVAMLQRDVSRLQQGLARMNQLPLGAGALAGTTFPIDRQLVANLLKFQGVCENSLDAVSDRDFAIEFAANSSLIMMHLSRFAEELVLWSSPTFNFIELPDRFCTGSSIMPQKKNPDIPELVRGKSGRVIGHLMSLLVLMKAQPLAYNKDNQEDKEPIFDTVDTVNRSLRSFIEMMAAVKVKPDQMAKAAAEGYSTATDLADYLVRKTLPFREAHEVVGRVVKLAIQKNKVLEELTLSELQEISNYIQPDVFDYLSVVGSVNARDHIGGTAPKQVLATVESWRNSAQKHLQQLENYSLQGLLKNLGVVIDPK